MTKVSNGTYVASRSWQMLLATIPALYLGACADQASAPADDHLVTVTARTINDQTGAIHEHTAAIDPSAWKIMMGLENDAEKAGCVHIRFCRTSFVTSNDVLCDTNDIVSSACSSSKRFSECTGDATAVCGRSRPMGFDPPIRCPISGVSSLLCPSGESLVWFNTNVSITEF